MPDDLPTGTRVRMVRAVLILPVGEEGKIIGRRDDGTYAVAFNDPDHARYVSAFLAREDFEPIPPPATP